MRFQRFFERMDPGTTQSASPCADASPVPYRLRHAAAWRRRYTAVTRNVHGLLADIGVFMAF